LETITIKYTVIVSIICTIFLSVLASSSESFAQNASNSSTCELTVPSPQGPFYREGSPQKDGREFAKGIEGEKIVITGKVLNSFTCEPISGAVLDIWAADSNGKYDTVGFNLRGKVISDETGNYTLETIIPGYEVGGGIIRPAHIHVKAWVLHNPGNPTLVTQLYFEGDPYIDEFVKKQLILKPINKNGTKFANFDFGLEDYRETYSAIEKEMEMYSAIEKENKLKIIID
jgi:protocatechuate 3,4-dioxygenase beta subunit